MIPAIARARIENRKAASIRLSTPISRSKKTLPEAPISNLLARAMTLDLCANIQSAVGPKQMANARIVTKLSLESSIRRYSGMRSPVMISMIRKNEALNLPRIAAAIAMPNAAAETTLRLRICQAKARKAQPQPAVPATEWVRARCDSQPICGMRNRPSIPADATMREKPSSLIAP